MNDSGNEVTDALDLRPAVEAGIREGIIVMGERRWLVWNIVEIPENFEPV